MCIIVNEDNSNVYGELSGDVDKFQLSILSKKEKIEPELIDETKFHHDLKILNKYNDYKLTKE